MGDANRLRVVIESGKPQPAETDSGTSDALKVGYWRSPSRVLWRSYILIHDDGSMSRKCPMVVCLPNEPARISSDSPTDPVTGVG